MLLSIMGNILSWDSTIDIYSSDSITFMNGFQLVKKWVKKNM